MTQLDIIITNGWATLIGIAIALCLLYFFGLFRDIAKERDNFQQNYKDNENKIREQELLMQKKDAELKVYYQSWALEELDKFKKNEIFQIQKNAEEHYLKAAGVLLQQWKVENEMKIRQDAINRSYSVNLGKISEHLIPFHADFYSKFNPQDTRFIGSPIDLIIFDGHSEKKEDVTIYIAEIKTGNSRLTKTQQNIKNAVLKKQIVWVEINPDVSPSLKIFSPADETENDNIISEINKLDNTNKKKTKKTPEEISELILSLKIPINKEDNKAEKPTIEEDIKTLDRNVQNLINKGADDLDEIFKSIKKEPAYTRLSTNKDYDINVYEKNLRKLFE